MRILNFKFLLITLSLVLGSATTITVSAESHYVPGMGTYGVSNEKRTCSVCGKTFTAGSGHYCDRPDRSSSHSRSYGSSAEDRAAAATIDNDPSLLVNQTYFAPVDFSQPHTSAEGNGSTASQLLQDFKNGKFPAKKSHTTRNVIIALLLAGGAWWWYKRRD